MADNCSSVFVENKAHLQSLATLTQYENPKLEQLQKTLLEQFGRQNKSRGILFSKTRVSTHCLFDWVSTNCPLQDAGIKAAILTGAGNQASHMTQVSRPVTWILNSIYWLLDHTSSGKGVRSLRVEAQNIQIFWDSVIKAWINSVYIFKAIPLGCLAIILLIVLQELFVDANCTC